MQDLNFFFINSLITEGIFHALEHPWKQKEVIISLYGFFLGTVEIVV